MILATVKVGDFDRFWSVFTSDGAKLRRKHGLNWRPGAPQRP